MKKWISSLLQALRQFVWKWFFRTALILAFVAGAVGAILYLGQMSEQGLTGQDKYQIPFQDIDCDVPIGMTKTEFLDEVRYLANGPKSLPLLVTNTPENVAKVFAVHPWVKDVTHVQIRPPKTVMVRLQFREPVLVVNWMDTARAVDAEAVLLPLSAPTKGLPVFPGTPTPPKGAAGSVWSDPAIQKAAERAAQNKSARNSN